MRLTRRAERGKASGRRVRLNLGLWLACSCASLCSVPGLTTRAVAQIESSGHAPGNVRTLDQDTYAQAVQVAVEAYNRADYATARAHFSRAHELRPSARTWRGLGATAFELKQFDDAVRELTFALEDPRDALTPELRADTESTLRLARRGAQPPSGAEPVREVRQPQRVVPVARAIERSEPAAPEQPGLPAQRIAAVTVAGVGVAAIAVGLGFGLHSMSKGAERDRLCPDATAGCSSAAVRAADAALIAGDLATAACIAGAAAVAGGLVLWLTGAPSERPQAVTAPRVGIGPGTLQLRGFL